MEYDGNLLYAVETSYGKKELRREEVIFLLTTHHVPLKSWGTGSAKTIDHFLKEIQDCEITLEETSSNKLLRKLRTVCVTLNYVDKEGILFRLVEDKQIFHDGRERRRNMDSSLSEKILKGEDAYTAATRALREELGIDNEVDLFQDRMERRLIESQSYPGIHSEHSLFYFRGMLNHEQFNPRGYVEQQPDKDTYFIWEKT